MHAHLEIHFLDQWGLPDGGQRQACALLHLRTYAYATTCQVELPFVNLHDLNAHENPPRV